MTGKNVEPASDLKLVARSLMAKRPKYKICRGLNGHSITSGVLALPLTTASKDRPELVSLLPAALVRKEKVAEARKLIAESNYPSKEVLHSVAGLLARHLQPD
jgi:hypothetical protein